MSLIAKDRFGDINWERTLINIMESEKVMTTKQIATLVFLLFILLVLIFSAGSMFETVPAGYYQIKQAAVSGKLTAKMTPGLWWQNFGDIYQFPTSETFFFTKDNKEGKPVDESIKVTFADGSECDISGTARIIMPTTEEEALNLTVKLGFRDYHSIEKKLILPTIRRALVITATMMTAQESYNVKRIDFLKWASSQIEHGIAVTREIEKEVKDPVTGELVVKKFKEIVTDDKGQIVYESNPLAGTGIKLQNFEVKDFAYSDAVKKQIAEQQSAIMGVATAKANAQKAEQAKITAEAEGKAKVTTAQYEKEQEKIKAVVDAEKDKAVAVLNGQKLKEVADLQKQAAEFTKQEQILLGQGEAERKKLVMEADGALEKKIDAAKYMADVWAKAYASRQVPSYYVDGGSGSGSGSQSDGQSAQFMSMLNTQIAKNLGLDLSIKHNTQPSK